VVGIPWDQINHLAEAAVIGHEVGHIVESDFKMTEDLERLLEEALSQAKTDNARREAWNSWLSEIFADLYGCLAAGPAYAGTLLDYLANEKFSVENQQRHPADWTAYPTDLLRLKIIFRILSEMGFENEIKDYAGIYASYSSKMSGFEKDIDFIAAKLLEGKFESLNDKPITEVFNFTRGQQKETEDTARKIRQNSSKLKVELTTRDIRVLFAANRRSYEQAPRQHIENDYDEIVLSWAEKKIIEKGVRFGYVSSKSEDKIARYQEIGAQSVARIIGEIFD
jgi:hypothetical protein